GAMMQDPHKSVLPEAILEAVIAYAVGSAAHLKDPSAASAPPAQTGEPTLVAARVGAGSVRETPLFLPVAGEGSRSLFGIHTEPLDPPRGKRSPMVLFLNAGAVHRVGPNRMYVDLARSWAEHGLTSLRLDLSGLGDSPPAPGAPENKIYS